MTRCPVPSCGGGDEYDEDGNYIGAIRPHRRYHKPSVFDPPPPYPIFCRWFCGTMMWAKFKGCGMYLHGLVYGIYKDPYWYSIFRAVTLFGIGLKLFYDLYLKLLALSDCDRKKACAQSSRVKVDL